VRTLEFDFTAFVMKQISGKEFIRLVQLRGWILKRINGSHHILTKAGHQERIVVPVHGNQPLKIGLLKHQMKIAGLTEADL
jgi:predicted RNA binding protein YcfA (HicA-like mRNA interferase family)